jgi:steroid delta-isomerase-like uncharacterized protein
MGRARLGGPQRKEVAVSEQNKELVRRLFLTMINDGNLDAADGALAPDYRDHSPLSPPTPGLEGFKQRVEQLRSALEAQMVIHDVTAEGDRVAFRWELTGTHVGDFSGFPATGQHITLTGLNLERVADGKIVEHWSEYDRHMLFEQLGGSR